MRTVRPIVLIALALIIVSMVLLFVDMGAALLIGVVGFIVSAYCVVTSPAP